jgi:hypothetical protein
MKFEAFRKTRLTALFIGASALAFAQSGSTPAKGYIAPSQQVQLLRQPNGLAAVAAIVGHLELYEGDEVWGLSSLNDIPAASAQIIEGTLVGSESRLTDDGDHIVTDYSLRILRVIKGQVSGSVFSFSAPGGTVVFPNGTSAHIGSVVTDNFKKDKDYIVFVKSEEGKNVLVSGSASVFSSSSSDNTVATLDEKDVRCELVRKSLSTMSRSDLLVYLSEHAGKQQ